MNGHSTFGYRYRLHLEFERVLGLFCRFAHLVIVKVISRGLHFWVKNEAVFSYGESLVTAH